MNEHFSADELYQKGLQHFNHGEWREAIAALSKLEDDPGFPDAAQFLADARLKLQFEAVEVPPAMAPPRSPFLLRALITTAVILSLFLVGEVFLLLRPTTPVAAVAQARPTAVPPTATSAPTTGPTATTAPTATAAPTTKPTDVPVVAGSILVAPADAATFVNTPKNIEIVVDESGSMYAPVPGTGKQRWQIAQDALRSLIGSGTIAGESSVALRTYGRRKGNDCGDLEAVQGLSPFKADALNSAVGGLKPAVSGMTPLGASIKAAGDDLQSAEGSTVLIVVTDGLESCNGDPVAEATNFVKDNPLRKVHVIGFAIDNKEASDKLKQIAGVGHGLYFDAGNTTQLTEALRQTIVLDYQLLAADGKEVAKGTVGQGGAVPVQPGSYKLKINASPAIEKDVTVPNGGHLEVRVRQGYGGLTADVQVAK